MRGSIRKRYKGSWSVIIDLGYQPDPETGELKRKQKWFTVRGTKRDAEKKLAELLYSANRGELAEPTKLTLGAWLDEWLETAIKPPNRRILTYNTYRGQIENHLKPKLGSIRLQQLQPTDLQRYYIKAAETLGRASLLKHHSIIHTALKAAQMQGIVSRNVADLVIGKPRTTVNYQKAMEDCWTADEARAFLTVAQAEDPQTAALYTLALDSGARKGELCGLRWEDVDLKEGQITIVQQLTKSGMPPLFGQPKTELLSNVVA